MDKIRQKGNIKMFSEKGSLKDTSVMKLLLSIFELELTGILYLIIILLTDVHFFQSIDF